MELVALGNIHGELERFKRVFDAIVDYSDFDAVLFTGNFGSYSNAKKVIEYVSKKGFSSVSVYGSDDDYYFKQLLKGGGEHHIMNGIFLGLGAVTRLGGLRILGIGGLKGSGRYWYEWRERTIYKIMENVEGRRIDVVLAYEYPKNYSSNCIGSDNCGRYILKKLVEEVEPSFYIAGRNHVEPTAYEYENGTIIVESGSINISDSPVSYATLIKPSKREIETIKIGEKGETLALKSEKF